MRASWVPVAAGSPFPLENLPLGVATRLGEREAHLGIAIGESVFDLAVASRAGLYDDVLPNARALLGEPSWNGVFAFGRSAVRAIRERTATLLARGGYDKIVQAGAIGALVELGDVALGLPVAPGDYVDFYASIAHATRVGRLFRPAEPPLPPNYRSLPIGYHGRASSIVPSGTDIARPAGQWVRDGRVVVAPSAMLDYELELAYVTARGPALGTPIPVGHARDAIVGAVLLNDWSARDLQQWEYRPLGPFLGKSFATSLGAWIVTLDALEPYRVPGAVQVPEPFAYLRDAEPRADDVRCEIALSSAAERAAGAPERILARPHAASLYWSAAQMLAHLTSNGARVRAGDVFATGTISSGDPDGVGFEPGSLLERDEQRFLDDGDEVVFRAWCGDGSARPRIGFGEVRGRIVPARAAGV